MKFLICGLGSIGQRHLQNLMALGEEDIGLYRTGNSTLPDVDFAHLPVEHDLGAALERWQPEAVLITNPTSLHLEAALAGARSGAHLFIEKPISHKLAGIKSLKVEVAERNIKVLVGYQFRFHPGLLKAKDLIEAGTFGRIISASAHWGEYLPDWHPWEDYRNSYSARQELGGGVVLTLSHPIDYLRWLIGEIVGVSAATSRPDSLEIEAESLANICMRHKNGATSHLHLNYWQRPPRHDLEIVGEKGTLRWANDTGKLSWWTKTQQSWQIVEPPLGFERNTMFVDEMEHFLQLLSNETESRCSLEDGEAALAIALAALRASETGKSEQYPEKAWV